MEINKLEFEILFKIHDGNRLPRLDLLAKEINIEYNEIENTILSLNEKKLISNGYITPSGLKALEPYRVKTIIFIAAGFGHRMIPITLTTPKGLVEVNGIRMIDTMIDAAIKAEINNIVIVRGYLAERFDELLDKYPQICFIENTDYNNGDNIISANCARHLFENAYIVDSDFILNNPNLIKKYEYESMHCGIHVNKTDDWCINVDKNKVIVSETYGGEDTYLGISVAYFDSKDGKQLSQDIEKVLNTPEGIKNYWQAVPFTIKKDNYSIKLKECSFSDIIEIDTFDELKAIDKTYDM